MVKSRVGLLSLVLVSVVFAAPVLGSMAGLPWSFGGPPRGGDLSVHSPPGTPFHAVATQPNEGENGDHGESGNVNDGGDGNQTGGGDGNDTGGSDDNETGGSDGNDTGGSDDNETGDGGDGNETGDGGDGNETGDGGDHNDTGDGGDHNETGDGGDGNETGDGGDHNDTGDGGDHNETGGGDHNGTGHHHDDNETNDGGNETGNESAMAAYGAPRAPLNWSGNSSGNITHGSATWDPTNKTLTVVAGNISHHGINCTWGGFTWTVGDDFLSLLNITCDFYGLFTVSLVNGNLTVTWSNGTWNWTFGAPPAPELYQSEFALTLSELKSSASPSTGTIARPTGASSLSL